MKKLFFILVVCFSTKTFAQKTKLPVSISGSMGVTYEGYGLNLDPNTPFFYAPRRPWNQFRFNFAPQIKIGKDFSLPINFSFLTKPTNYAGAFGGIGALSNQTFSQFITNPLNNFSINPKYKWAQLLLGTQYLNYSELSTGDVGVFGAGFDLKPKNYILKFFTGNSQQGINYNPSPLVPGAYKRHNWMAQIGKEKEGKFKVAFSAAKGRDYISSVTIPPLFPVNPQEGFVLSFLSNLYFKKGYYAEIEGAQSYYTDNMAAIIIPGASSKSFEPFIKENVSTKKDYGANAAFGKKSKNFDIGIKGKYLGAGFFTMGYPYQQSDKLDLTVNTRFNAWKDKNNNYKTNVVASIGNRINNMSNTSLRGNQFIANLNWFTQFNERFSLNMSYNNFGFNTTGTSLGYTSVKNVSNDIGVNPTYTWSNTKMSHLLSLSYSYSKYNETITTLANITTTTPNTTHTALLTYIPTFFNKKITPDFSLLYFSNTLPAFKMQLLTVGAGLGLPVAKDKINLRGQLQYTLGKISSFTKNNNIIASMTVDYAITKKIKWSTFMTSNYFKYGNELSNPLLYGANYLESTLRTGVTYKWK